jgi:UDP-N-acetylmuramate dehydrogenase
MSDQAFLEEMQSIGGVVRNEPMSRHTTFGVGGPADFYIKVDDRTMLRDAMLTALRHELPYCVLGSGSNVLVGDGGIRGLVIENNAHSIDGPEETAPGLARLRVDSGMSFASLARRICRLGYWGLDWAVGIPGSLGGAVVYNAGAYGGSLADALISIDTASRDGTIETLPASALSLEYRGSVFTRGIFRDRVVLSVELKLRLGDPDAIMQRIAELESKRKKAQPPGRNAGSVFKNPPERPAWWYIDQVGLRGARIEDALISEKHANFFMNVGRARAGAVKALMDVAQSRVWERFGVELHPEVALIGEGFCPTGAKP